MLLLVNLFWCMSSHSGCCYGGWRFENVPEGAEEVLMIFEAIPMVFGEVLGAVKEVSVVLQEIPKALK